MLTHGSSLKFFTFYVLLISNLNLPCSLGVFCWQALHPGCLQCGEHGVAWDRVRNAPRFLCNDVQTTLQRIDPVQQVSESSIHLKLNVKLIVLITKWLARNAN